MKKVTYKNMIYVPKDLRTKVMKWFHHYLYYPEEARMHKTLTSTYYRKKMDDEIRQFLKQCPACQRFKKEKKKKKNWSKEVGGKWSKKEENGPKK